MIRAHRLRDWRYELERVRERLEARAARLMGRRLRRAAIVHAAVRATTPPAIAPDAYAGPDRLTFKRIMDHA